jgi:hypothetical protein
MSSGLGTAIRGFALGCWALSGCYLDLQGTAGEGGTAAAGGNGPGVGGGGGGVSCGDGMVGPGEDCDGANLGEANCRTRGFDEGTLACSPTCTFDTSDCVLELCGNGTIDPPEDCDGSDLGGASCESRGYLPGGTLACVADCSFDDTGCVLGYTTNFEGGMPAAFVQTGNLPWTTQGTVFHTGAFSAQSGAIANNQTTGMQLTLVFAEPGEIRFFQRVSSENGFDFLRFFIDGAQQTQWSGTSAVSFTEQSYPVTAGTHVFEWRYAKDFATASGSDAAWVDDILAVGGELP